MSPSDPDSQPTAAEGSQKPGAERIGGYKILELLGEGGMGTVYLAEQKEPVRRFVALKVIRPGLDSTQVVARFESERQALALMDHPYIARVLDAGATGDGRPYFVMEYVKGEPITAYCDRVRLTTRERAALMVRVCGAIQHAHQRAVVHRDIKPSNVLVTEGDREPEPKIIDFGVAKAMAQPLTDRTLMTEFGQVIGTPDYMSPEQADTTVDRVDTRTDVYSLGVLFYEMLVGALPIDATELRQAGMVEALRRVREDDPSKPSTRASRLGEASSSTSAERRGTTPQRLRHQLRGDLDWITMKAIEKEPARRYGSALEFALDIERFLRNEPVLAGPPSAWYRVRKFTRRHRVGVAFAVVVTLLLITLAVMMVVQARRVAGERDRANAAAARATREAATARRVSEFLSQVFDGADPGLTGGRVLTARQLLDRGADRIHELGDQPAVQAELRTVMASVYLMLGAFDVAEPLIESAVQHHEANPAQNPRGFARSLHLRASLLDNGRNQPERAEVVARRAVALWEELGESVAQAESLNMLATAIWHQDRIDEAAATFREAIAILEREFGPDSPEVVAPLTNLGSLYLIESDYAEAEKIYKRVIAVEEAQPDPERQHGLATTLHLLAMTYEKLARYDEGIAAEERSLRIRERVLGDNHWHVALSLTTLGNLLRATDRATEAEPLQERAVKIAASTWKQHPDRWWAERCLARTRVACKHLDPAEAAMQAQREVLEKIDGEEEALAEVLEILGAVSASRGDMTAAEDRYRRAAAIFARVVEPENADRQRVLWALAAVLSKNEKSDEAAAIVAELKALVGR